MKDEYANQIVADFVALRSKTYALKFYKGNRIEKNDVKE